MAKLLSKTNLPLDPVINVMDKTDKGLSKNKQNLLQSTISFDLA